jgi:hypothetical protein
MVIVGIKVYDFINIMLRDVGLTNSLALAEVHV